MTLENPAAPMVRLLTKLGYNVEGLTSIETTYDDSEITSINLYVNGVFTTAIDIDSVGFRALADEVDFVPVEDFEVYEEGPVGPYGADRAQWVLRLA